MIDLLIANVFALRTARAYLRGEARVIEAVRYYVIANYGEAAWETIVNHAIDLLTLYSGNLKALENERGGR